MAVARLYSTAIERSLKMNASKYDSEREVEARLFVRAAVHRMGWAESCDCLDAVPATRGGAVIAVAAGAAALIVVVLVFAAVAVDSVCSIEQDIAEPIPMWDLKDCSHSYQQISAVPSEAGRRRLKNPSACSARFSADPVEGFPASYALPPASACPPRLSPEANVS